MVSVEQVPMKKYYTLIDLMHHLAIHAKVTIVKSFTIFVRTDWWHGAEIVEVS